MAYQVEQNGFVSQSNSSTALLGSSGVFTGDGEEVSGFANASIFIFSDVASATDGLSIQWSSDNVNWDDVDVYTISANNGKQLTFGIQARYFRVVYTNGGSNQNEFRLQTLFHNVINKPSSHRILDKISAEHDAELVMDARALVEPRMTTAMVNIDGSGDNQLVSATAGKTTKLYKAFLAISPAVTLRIKDNATLLTGPMNLSSITLDFDGEPWFVTSSNSSLVIHLASATQVSGRIYYIKD